MLIGIVQDFYILFWLKVRKNVRSFHLTLSLLIIVHQLQDLDPKKLSCSKF
jgi:hypothetical protein